METDDRIQITSAQVTDELSEHMEALQKVIKRGQNIKLLPTMFIVCCHTRKHYRNPFPPLLRAVTFSSLQNQQMEFQSTFGLTLTTSMTSVGLILELYLCKSAISEMRTRDYP